MLMMPPALQTKSGAHRIPRSASAPASASAASWLLAAPAIARQRSRGIESSYDDSIPRLRCRAIAGAANNQLAADALAGALAERGILWAPDFVCNAGGIINIAVELEPEGYSPERADARVRAVGDTLRQIFDGAEAAGSTQLQAPLEPGRGGLGGEERAGAA